MGNAQTKKQIGKKRFIDHPIFNSYNNEPQYQGISSNDAMFAVIPIQQQNCFTEWQVNLNKITTVNEQSLLLPKNYQYSKKSLCGTSGIVKIHYDNYPYILMNEIQNRREVNKRFTQEQLWYLLYILVWSHTQFHSYQTKLGDVRPQNLFINQMGQVKVVCKYSWPNQLSNYQKTLYQKIPTYLSPQQLEECRLKRTITSSNPQRSQSFSIGLTILQSILLLQMQSLYDFNKFQFHYQTLQKYIKHIFTLDYFSEEYNITKKYSNALLITIATLCQINPQNRITPIECYNQLKPHQVDILNLKITNIQVKYPLKYQLVNNQQPIIQQNILKPYPKYKTHASSQSTQKKQLSQTPVKNYPQYIPTHYPTTIQPFPKRQLSQQHVSQFKLQNVTSVPVYRLNSLERQSRVAHQSPSGFNNNRIITIAPSTSSIKKYVQHPVTHQSYIIHRHYIPIQITPRQQMLNVNQTPQLKQHNIYSNGRFGRFNHDNINNINPLKENTNISSTANHNNESKQASDKKMDNANSDLIEPKQSKIPIDKHFHLQDIKEATLVDSVRLDSPYFNVKNNFIHQIDEKIAKSSKMFPSY